MKILVIAPHPDDEVLGVGASMAKYAEEGNQVFVCIVTRAKQPLFTEAFAVKAREETIKAHRQLGVSEAFFLDFPAVMLENVPRYEMNDKICDIIQRTKPDIVYIPHFGDMQKDHQLVAEAAMVALRPKYEHRVGEVYAYETLSETEWNTPHSTNTFIPNTYVDVTGYLEKKLEAMSCYGTQLAQFPNPRSLEAIIALAKLRGSTIQVEAAEAFSLIRKAC